MNDKIISKIKNRVVIACLFLFGFLVFFRVEIYNFYIDRKYDQAMDQCKKYGGAQGDTPVVTEGIYDAYGRGGRKKDIFQRASTFLNNGLQYFEIKGDHVLLNKKYFGKGKPYYKSEYWDVMPFYRVYLTKKGDFWCGPYEKIDADWNPFSNAIVNSNQCVGVKPINTFSELKAPYELIWRSNKIEDTVTIEWWQTELVDRETQKVVAAYHVFSHCITHQSDAGFAGGKRCSGPKPKVQPSCPAEYSENPRKAIDDFENDLVIYKGENQ